MILKNTKISISIEFLDEIFAEVVLKSLEPENKQIDDKSEIQMELEKQNLLIKFSSTTSLITIRNTIDDILSTINTSENIYKAVKQNSDGH